ncbi:MAG: PQQ-binding-like beta-propeller repeat protein, partial [Opitutae bacterium]|nr:PQQ-binding-like beta-propeller repeat protein [Opitutae bacterium]
KLLWRYAFASGYRDGFGMAEGPRSTPTIAGGKVFAYGPQGILNCLDLKTGKLKWTVNVAKQFRSPQGFFGRCCSPLVVGTLVMIDVGGSGAGVVAFDVETGKVRWESGEYENDYSSPVHATIGDVSCAMFFMRDGFWGLNAETGKELFFERFRSPINASVNAATPLLVGNTVFVTSCYDVGGAAWSLKANGATGVGAETIWKKGGMLDGHYATPVHHDGYLYGFHGRQERGPELRCVSLADGSVQWSSGRMASGNLLLADGKLFVITEAGELLLVPASPKGFSVLYRQQVLGLEARAHFAISNGKLYARDKRRLVCLQLDKD